MLNLIDRGPGRRGHSCAGISTSAFFVGSGGHVSAAGMLVVARRIAAAVRVRSIEALDIALIAKPQAWDEGRSMFAATIAARRSCHPAASAHGDRDWDHVRDHGVAAVLVALHG